LQEVPTDLGPFRREVDCPICRKPQTFSCPNDYVSGRDGLAPLACPYGICLTRERALMRVLASLYSDDLVARLHVHEIAPGGMGLTLRLMEVAGRYTGSGYFPKKPFGSMVGHLRNENAEAQTFPDETFDLVVHLDVMEHLFDPFRALTEICRTLKPGARCLFTAPTYAERVESQQVAALQADGSIEIVGTPEYHGNPQSAEGSLVTWRYGYDLPVLIHRATGFDVEVRRFHAPASGVFGPMTEVYVLTKAD
jgi:SAM-dependent methyltransferase